MNTLTKVARDAAELIRDQGWTTGTFEAPNGALCLHGAVQACNPQPGDGRIVSAVMNAYGHGTEWNDNQSGDSKVLAYLDQVDITDAMLAMTFGPQWKPIVALVRQAAGMTRSERARLPHTPRDATWAAARGATRSAAWAAKREASWTITWAMTQSTTRSAEWYAAGAIVVADLVGQHDLEQRHIDMLLAPWISVMGDPRALLDGKDIR